MTTQMDADYYRKLQEWERDEQWCPESQGVTPVLRAYGIEPPDDLRVVSAPEPDTGNILVAFGLMALSGMVMGLILGALLWRH
jgi:hypothetical protein